MPSLKNVKVRLIVLERLVNIFYSGFLWRVRWCCLYRSKSRLSRTYFYSVTENWLIQNKYIFLVLGIRYFSEILNFWKFFSKWDVCVWITAIETKLAEAAEKTRGQSDNFPFQNNQTNCNKSCQIGPKSFKWSWNRRKIRFSLPHDGNVSHPT